MPNETLEYKMGPLKRGSFIAWKVFSKDPDTNEFRSAFVQDSSAKYTLTYPKGKIVRATEGSIGIFAFETEEAAKEYLSPYGWTNKKKRLGLYICRVFGYGKRETPEYIGWANKVDSYYRAEKARLVTRSPFRHPLDYQMVPNGTLLFDAIARVENGKAVREE